MFWAKAGELSPPMGAAVHRWSMEPSLPEAVSEKSCLASNQVNDAWCPSALRAAQLLSSSLFAPGTAMDGRNGFQTV